jgi:hypothetical protein
MRVSRFTVGMIAAVAGMACPLMVPAEVSYHTMTNDASSEISSSKTYTHAIDFGSSGAATVNGVVFATDVNVAAGGRLNSGSRTYGPSPHGGNTPPAVSENVASVFADMHYNGPDLGYIELTGLVAGTWYDVRLYDRAWDYEGALRTFYIGYDVGGDGSIEFTSPKIDQNRAALIPPGLSGNVSWAMSHVYQADASGKLRVIIDLADDQTGTYHLYGLTNQELPPLGGIYWIGAGISNVTATSAWAYATVNTNLADAVLVWDTEDRGDADTNAWLNAVSLGSNGAGMVTGEMTGLQADTSYTWRFYGINVVTNGWSRPETFSTVLTSAQTPVFTSAVPAGTSIALQWQDNAGTETGYVLRRSDSGSGGSYTVIATLGADTTLFTDGVSPSTTYHYQLSATNSANGSGTDFAACQISAATEEAGEVVYEPFDYSPVLGNIHGQDGGLGFDGAWVSTISHGRIFWMVEPGLAFTDDHSAVLPVAGNAVSRYGSAGRSQAHRLLSEESRAFLTGGATMWFSALFRSPSAHRWASLVFGTYKFSTHGVPVLGDGDTDRNPPFTPVNGDGFGFTLMTAALGAGNGTLNALAFDNSSTAIVADGTFTQPLQAGATHHDASLVVGKINWKPDGTPDELFLFNVTDLSTEPDEGDATASITSLDLDQSAFDTLAIWDTNSAITDEIRFGTTFAAVVGRGEAPEPPIGGTVLLIR